MNDWIDELRNVSEFSVGNGPIYKPSITQEKYFNFDVVKESCHGRHFNFKQHRQDAMEKGKIDVVKKSFEDFCDREYNFYISKLNDCKGRKWFTESFNHSHISRNPDVRTDLVYCYDRGLFMVENEDNGTSIFAILPVFSKSSYHSMFFGATQTLLIDDNGRSHFAYIGFVRNDCKSHAFHEFFPKESIISTLPDECPVTGLKASYLFDSLKDKCSDCKEEISLLSKNDEHSSTL
jgi:hypothetical protein